MPLRTDTVRCGGGGGGGHRYKHASTTNKHAATAVVNRAQNDVAKQQNDENEWVCDHRCFGNSSEYNARRDVADDADARARGIFRQNHPRKTDKVLLLFVGVVVSDVAG